LNGNPDMTEDPALAERLEDMPGTLHIATSGDGAQRLVEVIGELDMYTSPRLREVMLDLIDDGARTIVIDMAELTLIDSTGLGVLVGILKRILQHGGDLELRSPRRAARRVIEITGLDRVFTIVD
jgi:anti-sigma B factor antagonist